MSNEIPASVGGSLTVAVTIPTFEADGTSGSGDTKTLTFSSGAPPTDGSIGLAFITLNPSLDTWAGGGTQRLAYFRGATVGGANGLFTYVVPDWSFVADGLSNN
jgi:hypothetical protein